jgi:pilus assembly protein FimV
VAGRHLEDYPEVIARLQACWDDPVEAMALLEAMLFRRADASDLFDLPAYRDVLLLYSLARDVAQHSGIALPSVDVLLPLVCDNPDEADGPLR